jgi:predicted XRE-type DNA-binding protein
LKKPMTKSRNFNKEGEAAYQRWHKKTLADPEVQKGYAEEAAKMELWLQLAEARQAAGLTQEEVATRLGVTQSQVSRMEKRGYDNYTLNSLRRYLQALGDDYTLEVAVSHLNAR